MNKNRKSKYRVYEISNSTGLSLAKISYNLVRYSLLLRVVSLDLDRLVIDDLRIIRIEVVDHPALLETDLGEQRLHGTVALIC